MVYIVCAWEGGEEEDRAKLCECATVESAEEVLEEFVAEGTDPGDISVYQAMPCKFTVDAHIEVN